jgi:DNA (cytosine-5)-methyltransferase 1
MTTYKTVAEFFAGIGLVRLGLERAGWQVVYANDFDPKKREMYSAYFSDADHHYFSDNIFDLEPATIPNTLLATASFPCIDLSLAGNMNGLSGGHSSAFWGFISILKAKGDKRPPLILVENVPGLLTSNNGADFRATIEALNDLGYMCDAISLDAIRFTPQSRQRIFIIGTLTVKQNNDMFQLYQRPSSIATKAVKDAITSNLDLVWNFLPIPDPPLRDGDLKDIIEDMDTDDPRWWKDSEVERHLAMMVPLHMERIESLLSNMGWSYKTMYRRRRAGETRAEIRSDNKAGCLRTARGGSSRQMVVAVYNGKIKMRHMTPREYARLQGVPDNFPLPENVIQALTGFGDAVSVPVITWVAENVLNPLVDSFLHSLP